MNFAAANLTPRAEREFQRAAEQAGASVIERDTAERCTAAASFEDEVEGVLEAVVVLGGKRAVA